MAVEALVEKCSLPYQPTKDAVAVKTISHYHCPECEPWGNSGWRQKGCPLPSLQPLPLQPPQRWTRRGLGMEKNRMIAQSLQSCPTLCDPMDCSPPGFSVHGDSPGKNTGVGFHALLQGIFPTQGSNLCLLCLLHFRWTIYPLSHLESLRTGYWCWRAKMHIKGMISMSPYSCIFQYIEKHYIH